MTYKHQKICGSCGGENIWVDANAQWDVDRQMWVLLNTFDAAYCDDCESSTDLVDRELGPLKHLDPE